MGLLPTPGGLVYSYVQVCMQSGVNSVDPYHGDVNWSNVGWGSPRSVEIPGSLPIEGGPVCRSLHTLAPSRAISPTELAQCGGSVAALSTSFSGTLSRIHLAAGS
ncbi:MAG TPA: hypothetical protein VF493_17070 [Terriglobales bacterium]